MKMKMNTRMDEEKRRKFDNELFAIRRNGPKTNEPRTKVNLHEGARVSEQSQAHKQTQSLHDTNLNPYTMFCLTNRN